MSGTSPRIVFMGTSDFASGILAHLLEQGTNLVTVVTQPDKKVGRKQLLAPPPVKKLAEGQGAEIRQYKKIDDQIVAEIAQLEPDVIVVAAYGLILPKKLLDLPKFGCLNVHGSLLPKYRGASPIQAALRDGEEKTGITIMLMDEGVDTGPILSQKEVTVEPHDNFFDLQEKLILAANEILLPTIEQYLEGKVTPKKQDGSKASHTKLITKADGLINWEKSAESIYNKYRAFKSWPTVYTIFEDKGKEKKLALNEIAVSEVTEKVSPGKVIKKARGVFVGTGSGLIEIKRLTLEGSREIDAQSFINGKPHFINAVLKS